MSGCQQPHFVQAGQLCLQKILSWEGLLIQKCIITVAAFASIVQSVQLRSYLRLTAGLVQKNSEREETIKSMWFFCFSLLGYPHPGSRQCQSSRRVTKGARLAQGPPHCRRHQPLAMPWQQWAAGSPRAFHLGQSTACSLLCKTIASYREGYIFLNSLWLSVIPKPPQILEP